MSLTSSLYTGSSGLGRLGDAMQVIGNNISNVNTVAYKRDRFAFSDVLSETIGTQGSSYAQMGRGVGLAEIQSNFNVGSFESTTNSTDLAIAGEGFFVVRKENGSADKKYYTKAGNFHFDKQGQLVNAADCVIQGYKIDSSNGTESALKDVILDVFTSPPKATSSATVINTLSASTTLTIDSRDMASMYSVKTDGTDALAAAQSQHSTSISVYDNLGVKHDLKIYFDKKTVSSDPVNAPDQWEYIVTCESAEDNRGLLTGTTAKGLLARGTISFNAGKLCGMTMEEFEGRVGNIRTTGSLRAEDINFSIENSQALEQDAYDLTFEYTAQGWRRTSSIPTNYANFSVVTGGNSSTGFSLDFDGNTAVADLMVRLDEAARIGDTITFDVNQTENCNVQSFDIKQVVSGDISEDTYPTINDLSSINVDSTGYLVRDSGDKTWTFVNGAAKYKANSNNGKSIITSGSTRLFGSTVSSTFGYGVTINTPDNLNSISKGINLKYNTTTTSWDLQRVSNIEVTSNSGITSDNISLSITGNENIDYNMFGASATWNSGTSSWTLSSALADKFTIASGTNANTLILQQTTSTKTPIPKITLNVVDVASTATAKNMDNGGKITFDIIGNSTNNKELAGFQNAVITTGTANSIQIDLDGNSSKTAHDIVISPSGTLSNGNILRFDIDTEMKPTGYENASLIEIEKDDKIYLNIDLNPNDGKGISDDVKFTFDKSDLGVLNNTEKEAVNTVIDFSIKGSTTWKTIAADATGKMKFSADFLGGKFQGTEQSIYLDFGGKYTGTTWNNETRSTTQYGTDFTTDYYETDGYGVGTLQGVSFQTDGIMIGNYTNGQNIKLYRLPLARFMNNQGLYEEGGNLYSETIDSGNAILNKAGTGGTGELYSNSLEKSNVDISQEFVDMITTQRGFQANSKIITTADSMLSDVIAMKR